MYPGMYQRLGKNEIESWMKKKGDGKVNEKRGTGEVAESEKGG